MTVRTLGGVAWLLVALSGCASVSGDAGFAEVQAAVEQRQAAAIVWARGPELDREAAERLRRLLGEPLTAAAAVQIALLNNRDLHALYADLGLARADLVQAGLLRNPILDAAAQFPLTGVRPDLQLGVVVGFLDALYIPLRRRVAAAAFEEVKLQVTGAVLDFAARTRAAFHVHQANEQILELRRTVVHALGAAGEVSRRLHEAGNISDLDLARDRVGLETARLTLRSAEAATWQSREELNSLMGLWGEQTDWQVDGRLADVPSDGPMVNGIERAALERSLDLAQARQRIVAAGEQLGYERATALVPSLEVGTEAEREDGWKIGPALSLALPIFDQGQARIGRGAAELLRARQQYHAVAVRIRAAARAARDRLLAAQDRARYYRDIVLPLHERIVNEAQLQYNAMQVGIFQLLRDREQQVDAGVAYVEALREYWLARAEVEQIVSGRLPAGSGARTVGMGGGRPRAKGNGNEH
jgi:cobalt-zinc-cadmium efflux system outer membrane protein